MSTVRRFLEACRDEAVLELVTRTDPDWKGKTGNPYHGKVKKHTRFLGRVNSRYEEAVNRQRQAEGNPEPFVAKPRKWGREVPGTPLLEHDGKLYLQVLIEDVLGVEYRDLKGQIIGNDLVVRFLKPKPMDSGRQGTERPTYVRTYLVENVLEATPWQSESLTTSPAA